jgi:hypothetical protein
MFLTSDLFLRLVSSWCISSSLTSGLRHNDDISTTDMDRTGASFARILETGRFLISFFTTGPSNLIGMIEGS